MDVQKNSWNLEPFLRVGVFEFGKSVAPYVDAYNLIPWEEGQSEDAFQYDISGTESYISTDNGKIVTVSCRDECNYAGKNLLGKTLDEIESILQKEAAFDENIMGQDIYEFDDLGLTIWFQENVAKSIDCSIYIDPDEPA
jgi:hypothetical protein